ncbi:MAG: PAS domain S-box protein, partial [Bacteroidales bacterium]|nr:PAS domain S-box protein [Bacteroidales bacterium]
ISNGEIWKGEFHNKKKNGDLFWENVTISPIKNDKGIITNFLAIKEDITEIKEAAKALKTSEEKIINVFENSPNMYYSHDLNHQLTYASSQVKNILGYTQKEILVKWTELTSNHPINKLAYDKTIKAIESGESQGSFELELIHKSGEKVWVEAWEFPHKEDGKVTSIVGSLREITESKKSQQIQKLIFNVSNAINTSDDLIELLGTIRTELGSIIDTTNFYVAVYDKKTETLNFPFYSNEKDHYTTASASKTITKYIIDTKTPLLANIETKKQLFKDGHIKYQGSLSKVWLGVPINLEGEMKAVLAVESYTDENAYSLADLEMLQYISEQISIAINKKEAERKLRESELRFKQLFEDLGDAVFVTKIAEPNVGKILEVNAAAMEQTGYNREELLEMNIMSDLAIPHTNELNLIEWEQKLQNGETVKTVDKKRRKDGSEYWTEIIITPIEFKGEDACISINHDISERIDAEKKLKESEERFKQLSDLSFEGILIHKNGIALDFNITLAKMFGYENDEVIGKNLIQLAILEEYHALAAENIMKNHAAPYEVVGRKKDGSILPLEIESMSITMNNDESIRVTAIRDITERNKAKEELIRAKEKAEESDRLKSAFLANMSHEIRTPMNGILGFTSLLQEPDLTEEEMKAYSIVIERSGQRMLDTVNNLIDISKIESGQMNIHITEVNINTQIDNLYQFFKVETENKNLALSFSKGLSDKRALINTDDEKLFGILTNLIKNAIKFTDKGSIEFGYSLNKKSLNFFVKDTGIGIPLKKQKSVFERFTQADLSLSSQYEGSGLGLSITKAYIQMLHGKLWMESQEGFGSSFYFSIPYSKINNDSSIDHTNASSAATENVKKLKILIADDDETSQVYLSTVVKSICKEVIFAKDGQEVIDICKNNQDLDLILMDIKMPIINGYDASREIRSFNKDIIMLAQTAYALTGDKEKALESGCNDYIPKPIMKKELFEMINKYIKIES